MSSHEDSFADEKRKHDPVLAPDHPDEKTHRNISIVSKEGTIVNASGHRDQLQRQYGLWSICSLALTIDNAWIAFAGSLQISLLNGGPPGVLYEYIVACVYYALIGASIAELASSIPSSGGVYHWASVTPGPRYGRILGFFTGSLNFFGWIFDLAAIISIPANVLVQMYAVFHPDFVIEPWHAYVAYVCVLWLVTAFVIFCNRLIPYLQYPGLFLIIGGGLITIIVVAAMPKQHASTAFVFKDWNNLTGLPSGIAFLSGVLNGAFTIGTPDAVTHLAEELPNPKVDLPKAIFAQIGLGFITAFVFAISIFYGINDLNAVLTSTGASPLGEIYSQATGGSQGATFGLLLIVFLSIMICSVGTLLMIGRLWWTLARDNVTPFAGFFSRVNEKLSCPVEATVFCAILATGLGAIQVGSKTAFTDLVGSFIILTSMSYFLAIFPHILTKRQNIPTGPFWMGSLGYLVNGSACALIVFFNFWFCWPYAYPVTTQLMNYNSVILVGVVVLTVIWWFVHGLRKYPGPKLAGLYLEGI